MTVLLAVIAVLGVSASGPLMASAVAPALAIAFWRNGAGALLLAPFALSGRRAEYSRLSRRGWATATFAGVMLAAHFATWITALKLTSVAAATALVTTQLIWVVLIDRIRGIRPSMAVIVGMGMSLSGVLTISGFDLTLSSRAITGDMLAIAGGLFAAGYLVAGSSVRATLSTTSYTFVCYGICALVLLATCAIFAQPIVGFSLKAWLLIAGVTISAQMFGHSLFNHLLGVMSPTVISLIILLEVPGAAILAAIFLHQSPPLGVYAGLTLILFGLAVVASNREKSPDEPALVD